MQAVLRLEKDEEVEYNDAAKENQEQTLDKDTELEEEGETSASPLDETKEEEREELSQLDNISLEENVETCQKAASPKIRCRGIFQLLHLASQRHYLPIR
jgi:hypothetical protein